MCVYLCSDKGMSLSPRGVDNDMWEWISEVDQWNKATHVNHGLQSIWREQCSIDDKVTHCGQFI